MVKLKFKKLNELAQIPKKANVGDAGLDLVATSVNIYDNFIEYGTGLSLEFPQTHVALLFPRSSISNKNIILTNSVGVVDSGYRGEVKFRFSMRTPNKPFLYDQDFYKIGDKIGQLVLMELPTVEIEEATELSESDRATGGFGSSGA